MEIKLKELFGHNMQETGREGGEINFTQFIDSFEKSQLNTVRHLLHFDKFFFLEKEMIWDQLLSSALSFPSSIIYP